MRSLMVHLFVFALCVAACQANENSGATVESVRFNGDEFLFARDSNTPICTCREYIPKGQTLENWTKMAIVYTYPQIQSFEPMGFAETMARLIKQKNPLSETNIMHDKRTGAVMLDFVTWPTDKAFVEFVVFKFHKDGKKDVVAHQYAVREYKNQKEFSSNVPALRERSIKAMIGGGLEIVTPQHRTNKISSRQRQQRR